MPKLGSKQAIPQDVKQTLYNHVLKAATPLDLRNFGAFLTFLHHGIEVQERHLRQGENFIKKLAKEKLVKMCHREVAALA